MAYCSGCEKRHDSANCPWKYTVIQNAKPDRFGTSWWEVSDGDDED